MGFMITFLNQSPKCFYKQTCSIVNGSSSALSFSSVPLMNASLQLYHKYCKSREAEKSSNLL